jgi:hypothetical protein
LVRDIVGIILIAVAIVATVYFSIRGVGELRSRRLLPAIVVTGLGASLLIASYLWWLELGKCQSRGDLVCVLNENQGYLTLLALLLAAAGVWATLITSETVRHRAAIREARQARDALQAALEEVHHNLLHIALAFDGETIQMLPGGLSLDAVNALTEPICRAQLSRDVIAHVDPMRRNLQRLRGFEQDYMTAKKKRAGELEEILDHEPPFVVGLVSTSLRFALSSFQAHPVWSNQAMKRGFQDIPKMAKAISDGCYFAWRTSEIEAEGPDIRIRNTVVATWFDDEPVGVPTFAFGPRFADAAASHRH